MAAPQPHQQQQEEEEGAIDPFINEGGEGWLSDLGRAGILAYTGGVARGKAEGCGTIRCDSRRPGRLRQARRRRARRVRAGAGRRAVRGDVARQRRA